MPDHAVIVAYAFFYDITKILQDLPDDVIYYLLHEEKRAIVREGRIIYRSVLWKGYRLNFMNRRFSVAKGKKRVTVWDIFAFFQGKFTKAITDWKVASPEVIERIERMKDQRATFEEMGDAEIEAYCDDECINLAKLFRALVNAHNDVGLHLRNYFGAGSTAKALLKKFNAKEYLAQPIPEMRDAVARSFFGGRFENSYVGPITGRIHNYDISSAYPYQTYFLPCLIHGRWEQATKPTLSDIGSARLALCRWSIPLPTNSSILRIPAFGPFPVRSKVGTIAFPLTGVGGWVWKDEFLAGRKLAKNVQLREAWLYHTTCECHPFREIPNYYRERVRLGKDSKGIVLKLGPNAVYGSVAQSKGLNPPFQCWIWASNITSGCRAQLLELMSRAKNPWDIAMLATDGVYSLTELDPPEPRDTGTFDVIKDGKPVPLGGWEHDTFEAGVFCARPGIYFPLNPTDDQLKKVRARGIGKKALYERWGIVVRAWNARAAKCKLVGVQRFVGAKSAIHESQSGYSRSPDYGEWVNHPIEVSFDPAPKRAGFGSGSRLVPWRNFDWESEPYEPATKSPEAIALMLAELIAQEQPDTDFLDLDVQETGF